MGPMANGCIDFLSYRVPTATSGCTYLNRGTVNALATVDDGDIGAGYVHLSWLNSDVNASCTSGEVAEIRLASDGCTADECGWGLELEYAIIVDSNGATDFVYPSHDFLDLGHGPSIAVTPASWGRIKALMLR